MYPLCEASNPFAATGCVLATPPGMPGVPLRTAAMIALDRTASAKRPRSGSAQIGSDLR